MASSSEWSVDRVSISPKQPHLLKEEEEKQERERERGKGTSLLQLSSPK